MLDNPFQPIVVTSANGQFVASPLNVSASTSATSGNLPGNQSGDVQNIDIRIENPNSAWAYVTFGDGTQPTATSSNGVGFAPNSVEVMRIPPTANSVSVVLSTGTGSVRFTRGLGL